MQFFFFGRPPLYVIPHHSSCMQFQHCDMGENLPQLPIRSRFDRNLTQLQCLSSVCLHQADRPTRQQLELPARSRSTSPVIHQCSKHRRSSCMTRFDIECAYWACPCHLLLRHCKLQELDSYSLSSSFHAASTPQFSFAIHWFSQGALLPEALLLLHVLLNVPDIAACT